MDFCALGNWCSMRELGARTNIGGKLSILQWVHCGSSLSLRAGVRFSDALSVLDLVNLGSALSLRAFARISSSCSATGLLRGAGSCSIVSGVYWVLSCQFEERFVAAAPRPT
jgi:hypothetical protein